VTVTRLDLTDPSTMDLPDDLGILVNNAGFSGPRLPVEHVTPEMWRDVFEANFFGTAELTRRAVPLMRHRGGGVICDITTIARLIPQPFLAPYRASKSATAALLESLRAEVADFGIRIIEILPGPIRTDLLKLSAQMSADPKPPPYDDLARRFLERRNHHGDDQTGSVSQLRVNHPGTRPDEAARNIVAAILEPDGPFRYGCDSQSRPVLDAWRQAENEAFLRDAMSVFGISVG
jgi:NAD(P)-dependent dehydrogenase (short-subunit alcohol dehydrogenase family)